MAIEFPTPDQLMQKFVNVLIGEGAKIEELDDQWLVKHIAIGTRDMVYDQIMAAKSVHEDHSPFTAKGDALDEQCEEWSSIVRRKLAKKAIVRFNAKRSSPASVDTPIPVGSLITTQAIGDMPAIDFYVITTKDEPNIPVIPAGQTSTYVLAKCSIEGKIGNLSAGTTVHPGMVGVDTIEVVELVEEGADKEDDETLRGRLIEDIQNREKGGTEFDYPIWAKQITGVVSARSIPLARGNGTLDLLITGTNGLPTQELIDEVQAFINKKIPAGGCSVLVKAPTPIYVDVSAQIKLLPGFTFSTILPQIKKALDACIEAENKVLIVRTNKLRNAINDIEGVFNFTLDAPAKDIPLSGGELALPGIYTLTEVV